MTIFYLVRHGEVDWNLNEERQLKGARRDLVSLTEIGKIQAKEASKQLNKYNPELIVSSPYTRTLQTSAIISKELSIDIEVNFDLHEWLPDTTFSFDSIQKLDEIVSDYKLNNGVYPKGEKKNWEDKQSIEDRVRKVFKKYSDYNNVVIVTHGMVIQTILNKTEGIKHCEIIKYNLNEN